MSQKTQNLLCAIVTAASAAAGVWAQQGPPFVLNGQSWVDQQAFIDSGARCATRPIDDIEREEIDAFLASVAARGKGGQGRSAGTAAATGATINVYFHVITNTSGAGAPTSTQINSQFNVLRQPLRSLSKTDMRLDR